VILLSGDGGVVEIVNALLQKGSKSSKYIKPVISQLPLGTGNALFNSTHRISPESQERVAIPPSIYVQCLRTLLRGQPHPLPIFKASFSPGARFLSDEGRVATPIHNNTLYGAVVASYGLHSTLVADSDTTEYRKHGIQRFGMAAKELLSPSDGSEPHRYKGKVTLITRDSAGEEIYQPLERSEHMYILATLVSKLEEHFTISPSSQPLDGQLRLVHFGPLPAQEVMRIMGLAYQGGSHVKDKEVGYEAIDGLRIEFEEHDARWRRVCVDGKIVRVGKGGWVEVRRERRDVVDVVANV